MESLNARLPLLVRQFPRIGQTGIEQAATADPTPQKKYLTWILRMLARENVRLPEDSAKLLERLTAFDRLKKLPAFAGARDINAYKSYGDLAQAVEASSGVRSAREEVMHRQTEGRKLVTDHPPYKVHQITTPEAAMVAAIGTEWCTKDQRVCEDYLAQGPLYVVQKNGQKFAQIHGPTNQWQNVWDNDLDANAYSELHEVMIPVLGDDYRTKPADALRYVKKLGEIFENGEDAEESQLSDEFDLTPYEEVIATDAEVACEYAHRVLGEPFPLGEPVILTEPRIAAFYAHNVRRDRWPEAEPIIARDGKAAAEYAFCVLCGPWPEAEKFVFAPEQSRPATWPKGAVEDYLRAIHKGHSFDKATILQSPEAATKHARDLSAARQAVDEQTPASGVAGNYRRDGGKQRRNVSAAQYLLDWNASCGPSQAELEVAMAQPARVPDAVAVNAYILTPEESSPESTLSL